MKKVGRDDFERQCDQEEKKKRKKVKKPLPGKGELNAYSRHKQFKGKIGEKV